jgi:hypothetical protein
MMDDTDAELGEEQLDSVAGGALYYIVRKIIQTYRASSGRTHSGGGHAF